MTADLILSRVKPEAAAGRLLRLVDKLHPGGKPEGEGGEYMKLVLEGEAQEIADLVRALQNRTFQQMREIKIGPISGREIAKAMLGEDV